MIALRETVAAVLLPCLLMTGCQSASHAPTAVVTYQPGTPERECPAPRSRVYVLVKLPTTLPAVAAASNSRSTKFAEATAKPVEVERVYAGRGAPVGFRRSGTQLMAVAGPTEMEVVDARYSWRIAGPNASGNGLHPRTVAILQSTFGVIGVVSCVVLIGYLIHVGRHPTKDLLDSQDQN